ncbi:MAG TPA: metallophosphoesterase [Ramlibacter sp.]|nr:metallophosphoesterase [Ramlibacter sp.]
MKLNILSDLHLGHGALAYPANDADIVVLAGDIGHPAQAVAWACGLGKPVLYVPGNHEFYGGSIAGTLATLKQLCQGTQVQLLDEGEAVVAGVRFLGSTLWTDLQLFGGGEGRTAAVQAAQRFIRDYSRIFVDDALRKPFTPEASARLFQRHAAWLAERLAQPHDGATVVITHHAPSRRSIHPRFDGSLINACFVSELDHLLDGAKARLWIHGHTHDSFDYQVNGTRVVCNPRGYARNGVNENGAFDPDFIVDVA